MAYQIKDFNDDYTGKFRLVAYSQTEPYKKIGDIVEIPFNQTWTKRILKTEKARLNKLYPLVETEIVHRPE